MDFDDSDGSIYSLNSRASSSLWHRGEGAGSVASPIKKTPLYDQNKQISHLMQFHFT